MEALWESRAALIRQFGEREGRSRMAQIIIDGMKLAPPQSSMIEMRDAILLADRVDYQGASQKQLWEALPNGASVQLRFQQLAIHSQLQHR